MPRTGRPDAARSASTAAIPCARSQARSATVARLPGSTTRSASASWRGEVVQRTATPGSQASASTSVALQIRGSRTAATRSPSAPRGGPATSSGVSRARESSASRPGPAPTAARPASAARSAGPASPAPGRARRRSPRNLLITKPATSAWSVGREQGHGAEQRGEHAARGRCRRPRPPAAPLARASPMLARSCSRRLISAATAGPLADHHVVAGARSVVEAASTAARSTGRSCG